VKLVALVQPLKDREQAVQALVDAAGMAAAEARMRLAPEPPALLARLEDAAADALLASLRKAGLAAVAVEARVPDDSDRLTVRKFSFEVEGLHLEPRFGDAVDLPWPSITLILRGQRARRTESETVAQTKRFSLGSAVATGGLKMTRTKSEVVRASEEQVEQLVLLYAQSGVACFAESSLDFTGLGSLAPVRSANFGELVRRLREKAIAARYDDRLVRLGRRPLPFGAAGEERVLSGATSTVHKSTAGTVDVLAEVLRQAFVQGLV
jgi:hypothetical protein